MREQFQARMVRIHFGEDDKWQGKPLHEAAGNRAQQEKAVGGRRHRHSPFDPGRELPANRGCVKLARGPACLRRTPHSIYQPACKPGSVRHHRRKPAIRNGHSSGMTLAHHLEQPTRTASLTSLPLALSFSRTARVAVPIRSCSRWGLPCRFRCRTRGALLPHLFTLAGTSLSRGEAVRFLWHFPWGCPRRTLSGTACRWSPDFPPPLPFDACGSGRPAD